MGYCGDTDRHSQDATPHFLNVYPSQLLFHQAQFLQPVMFPTKAAGEGAPRQDREVTVASCGVVFVHSCPPAVGPHIEWAISGVLGTRVSLKWRDQPAAPRTIRTECLWSGRSGTATEIAAALRPWKMLRFEITEEPSPGVDGERIAYIPSHGVFRTAISASGDVVVGEEQLRGLLATANTPQEYSEGLKRLLGAAWDAELEAFRHAGEGAPVMWLHQVV